MSRGSRILSLAGTAACIVHAAAYWFVTSDDAFISLRYASHLATGQGLLYNPGQPPVEGFSNPAFLLLAALLVAAGIPALIAAKTIGLLALAVTAHTTGILATELSASGPANRARPLAVAMLAASPLVALWSVAGLETLVHATLVLITTLAAVRDCRSPDAPLAPWPAIALAASRPEGVLLAAAVAGAEVLAIERRGQVARAWATRLVLPVLALLGLRWWYFGAFAPNTYHAKVFWSMETALAGLGYVAGFLREGGWWVAVPALAGLVLARRNRSAIPVAAVLAAQSGFVIAVGGDSMPAYRFVMPIYPLLCACAAAGLARVGRASKGRATAWAVLLGALVCAGTFLQQRHGLERHPRRYWLQHEPPRWQYVGRADLRGTWLEGHRRVADYIRERSEPGDVLVVTEAGLIPFVTGLTTVDLLGLNDSTVSRLWQRQAEEQKQVATHGGTLVRHWAYDIAQYALSGRPRWVVLDGHLAANGQLIPRLDIGHWLMLNPGWSAYRSAFTAKTYDGRATGLGPDRVDVVFERIE